MERFRFLQGGRSSGFLIPIFFLAATTTLLVGCRERWVSSPEGTATTHVQNAGVLVYAPRSARVQKVVFDTADNQLIQEPDTPFRTFFNAHAADFQQGKLEYAKTTILGDIINLVENREFIREMIAETVDKHKRRAIRSLADESTVKRKALTEIQALENLANVVSVERKSLKEVIERANSAFFKTREAITVLDSTYQTSSRTGTGENRSTNVPQTGSAGDALGNISTGSNQDGAPQPAPVPEVVQEQLDVPSDLYKQEQIIVGQPFTSFRSDRFRTDVAPFPQLVDEIRRKIEEATAGKLKDVENGGNNSSQGAQQNNDPDRRAVVGAVLKILEPKRKSLEDWVDLASNNISTAKIDDFRKGIRDLVEALRTVIDLYQVQTGSGKALDDQTDYNANLLVNELFSAFNEAKYPDMRPEEIEHVLDDFLPARNRQELKQHRNRPNGEKSHRADTWDRLVIYSAVGLDLKQDLLLTLKEQRYFRAVIDKAVDKRTDLFRGTGASTAPLRDAQNSTAAFITNVVGKDYLAALAGGNVTLWQAFLNRLNRPAAPENGGVLIAPQTDRTKTASELTAFGNALKADVAAAIAAGTSPGDAMRAALQSRTADLRATGKGSPVLDAEDRAGIWKTKLLGQQDVLDAYTRLKDAAAKLNEANSAFLNSTNTVKTKEKLYNDAVANAAGSFSTADGATGGIQNGFTGLLSTQNNAKTVPASDASAVISTPENFTLYEVVTALATTADDGTACPAEDATCPHHKPSMDTKLIDIRLKLEALSKELTTLASDKAAFDVFDGTVSAFQALTDATARQTHADETARQILTFPGAQKTNPAQVTTRANTAFTPIDQFAQTFVDFFGKPDNTHGKKNELYEAANRLKTIVGSFKSNAAQSSSNITNGKSTLIGLKATMDGIRNAYREKNAATASNTPLTTAQGNFDTVKGATDGSTANSFYGVLTAAITRTNPAVEVNHRLTAALIGEMTSRIDLKLTEVRRSASVLTDSLDALLTDGLKIGIARNTAPAVEQMTAEFVAAFGANPHLVSATDAILKAFLDSAGLPFSSPSNKSTGVSAIVSGVIGTCSSQKDRETAGCGATPDPAKLASHIRSIMDKPEIALLFGPGQSGNRTINAFKLELYNAFKHRVADAVRAERKADYDYWWLTFYPKAVPLGDSAADGQSVIEVSFPRSATPQEQYHRWIQDRVDLINPLQKDADQIADCEEPNWGLRVQAATGVLNDFLIVLDASNLTDRYPAMRSTIIEALGRFSRNYGNHYGETDQNKQRYQEGINGLYEATKREFERTDPDINSLLQQLRDYGDERGVEVKVSTEQQIAEHLERRHTAKIQRRPSRKYIASFDGEFSPDTDERFELQCGVLLTGLNKDGVERDKERYRSQRRAAAKTDIAWNRFGAQHLLFAVSSAAETGITLPYKIELYAQAYFDGSRRFVTPVPQTDKPAEEAAFVAVSSDDAVLASVEGLDRFVSPFSTESQNVAVRRLLFLNGVNLNTLKSVRIGDLTIPYFAKLKDPSILNSLAETSPGQPVSKPFDESCHRRLYDALCTNNRSDPTPQYCGQFAEQKAAYNNHKAFSLLLSDSLLDKIGSKEDVTYSPHCGINSNADFVRNLASGLKYNPKAQPSKYLQHPQLWLWESRLQALREDLRFILVNLFQTSYPGVPDPNRIRSEFSKDDARLQILVYEWLRDLWMEAIHLRNNSPTWTGAQGNSTLIRERVRVLINLHLDRHKYVSLPSRQKLIKALSDETNIYEWIRIVTRDQKLMDALAKNLLNALYAPLWEALGRLEKIERQPIAYKSLRQNDFKRFRHWSKPKVQPGIQIIDLLPASRDDLVSMSINEGGVVAKLAAQADASAAYDLNKLRMATEFIDNNLAELNKSLEDENARSETQAGDLSQTITEQQRIEDARRMTETSRLRDSLSSVGYNLGARAEGSVYARAKAAVAYSKRREYLDAAITASGRGDNFAKWVVRKSDLRSELAQGVGEELVAAAHNGYPNGDQPFHLLVKIPHGATQTDWDGKPYIMFSSAYSATARNSWYKIAGFPGVLAKTPLALVNPAWWSAVEEELLATTYPFKWDVRSTQEQIDLISVPNTLGARLYLDDTDKIKFSAIRALVEAESAFIKSTRSAQSGELNDLMGVIDADSQEFRSKVRERMEEERQYIRDQKKALRTSNNAAETQQQLENSAQGLTQQNTEGEAPAN